MQQDEAHNKTQQQARHIVDLLAQAQKACRTDILLIDDPKAQALFETVAEVLGGTIKAMQDYQAQTEQVWRYQPDTVQQEKEAERQSSGLLSKHLQLPPKGPQPEVVTDMATDIDEVRPPSKLFTE